MWRIFEFKYFHFFIHLFYSGSSPDGSELIVYTNSANLGATPLKVKKKGDYRGEWQINSAKKEAVKGWWREKVLQMVLEPQVLARQDYQ